MIKKIYVNNYKSLVNTKIDIERMTLFLGRNGAGKSAVFDVVSRVREFLANQGRVVDTFPSATLTRWLDSNVQSFEIAFGGNGGKYDYRLDVEHNPDQGEARVLEERLEFDEKPLFAFSKGEVQLYRDDHSEGPSFTLDWERSGLASVLEGADNTKLVWFRDVFSKIIVAQPIPPLMNSSSEKEAEHPDRYCRNFVSWYRAMRQEYTDVGHQMIEDLGGVMPGFVTANLVREGKQQRALEIVFSSEANERKPTGEYYDSSSSSRPAPTPTPTSPSSERSYRFSDLGDGERALFVLYSLLRFQAARGAPLLIDEPGNYVGLRELQPFLQDAEDQRMDRDDSQIVLISHHPKIVNFLATSSGKVFRRMAGGPTNVEDYRRSGDEPLTVAEMMEMGELD